MDRKKIRVVCAVIESRGRILAARRGRAMSRPDLWEFPGGKVEERELPGDALRRELREELGIGVSVADRIAVNAHEYEDIAIELEAYRCTITDGAPVPIEHAEIRWVDAAEARNLGWAPADVPILAAVFADRK